MAHHNSTPDQILDAPSITVEYLHEHSGSGRNREQRRHYRTKNGATRNIPKRFQIKASFEPYVKESE